MKQWKALLSLLLAAALLLSGLSALAESGTFYEEMGFALDLDDIRSGAHNCVELQRTGVEMHDPFSAMMIVAYYALPEETVKSRKDEIANAGDNTEKAMMAYALQTMVGAVGIIVVANAESLADAGVQWPLPEGYDVTEFGAMGDYRWYFITVPVDILLDAVDGMAETGELELPVEEEKAVIRSDTDMIKEALLQKL